MSRWDADDLQAEDYDPNKDYSVQVKRQDGGLASTQRALQSIAQSEQIGAETAAELHRQREVMTRTKERLDESEQTLRESESHMKSIKSFWGQMHQKWFGPKIKDEKAKKRANNLMESTPTTAAPSTAASAPASSSFGSTTNGSDHLSARTKNTKAPTTREEQINSNLEQMSGGLSRLKNLGITLQNELESQDDLIDDVDAAIQRNNRKTDRMNRDMNNLLKKK